MKTTIGQRVSLVTGGTEGIGREVALQLARGGDGVLIIGASFGWRNRLKWPPARPFSLHKTPTPKEAAAAFTVRNSSRFESRRARKDRSGAGDCGRRAKTSCVPI